MPTKYKKILAIILIVLFFGLGLAARIYSLSNLGFEFDTVTTQHEWASQSVQMGFLNFWQHYNQYLDYLPGAILLITGIKYLALIFNNSPATFVLFLKIFNAILDLALIWQIGRFVITHLKIEKYKAMLVVSLLWVLPATWFVSTYWGQFDDLIVLLLFITFVSLSTNYKFAWQKWDYFKDISAESWSGFFLALAFTLKPQPLLFAPIFILYFVQLSQRPKLKLFLKSFLMTFVILNIIPFVVNPLRTLSVFGNVFVRDTNISNGASTFWTLFPQLTSPVSQVLPGVAVSTAGLIIFATICLVAALILIGYHFRENLAQVWQQLNKKIQFDFPQLILLVAIENLAYFIFMMGMHSRYAQFAIGYAFMPFFYLKKGWFKLVYLLAYLLFSLAYGLNQLSVFYYWYKGTVGINLDWLIYPQLSSQIVTGIYLLMLLIILGSIFHIRGIKSAAERT